MKNLFLTLAVLMTLACNPKASTSETTIETKEVQTDTTSDAPKVEKAEGELVYACPMHPEIQGKKGEECSKCGMPLTEPVK